MLKTTPPTAEPTPDVALTQVKHRRRPLLWVVAALLIAVGALLSGAVVNMVKDPCRWSWPAATSRAVRS